MNLTVNCMMVVKKYQCVLNSRQHQKSIKASATANVVSRMRRGVSHPSFTDVCDVGTAVIVGFEAGVVVATRVGS